ncbi:MAG: VOC family protein [Prochlorotrichaceae cyanobacterium]
MFHLAFPINNIADTKAFYCQGLGCTLGRESPRSLILNLGGHQIVAHLVETPLEPQGSIYPRHFGLILETAAEWEALLDRAQEQSLKFAQNPKHRFPGSILEHRTFFLEDPAHNLLEFKFYLHPEAIFGAVDQDKIGDPE